MEVNPNTEDGAEQMALLASQDAASCFQEAFSAGFAEAASDDVTVGEVSAVSVPFEPIGDDAAAFRRWHRPGAVLRGHARHAIR